MNWGSIIELSAKVGIVSLGCSKNLVDTEVMLGLLGREGYEITTDASEADVIIINTCSFIEQATEESLNAIDEFVGSDIDRKVIVTGCLAQRYGKRLRQELPGIGAILGTGDFEHIVDACEAVLQDRVLDIITKKPLYLYDHTTPRLLATLPHIANVKIAEGCDNRCSYCIIPRVRGRYRSRSIDSIVAEVEALTQAGVREIDLIAQDTTYYGADLKDGTDLTLLLRKLLEVPDVGWIRVLYAYPSRISDDFLELMAENEKLCSYVDVPVQHIHNSILNAMGRKTSQSRIRSTLERIRAIVPDVTLRTSLMVGFPGEGEEHFQALMDFVTEVEFDHLGVFAFSVEKGTRAARMGRQVPPEIKNERLIQIAALHRLIAEKKRQSLIGQKMVAMIDVVEPKVVARTQGQAPDIDDEVFILDDCKSKPGEFVEVEIVDTQSSYDLIGRLI